MPVAVAIRVWVILALKRSSRNSSPMSLVARAVVTSGRCQNESGKAMGPNALSRMAVACLVQIMLG
jgi:hypothetical protein